MRLCEHLHVQRQGCQFKLLSREGPMGLFSRSGTARHRDQDSTAPHASSQGCGISLGVRSFDCTKASICRGDGACSMSASWSISYLYLDNTMASHVD